jgi:hypothetical protein
LLLKLKGLAAEDRQPFFVIGLTIPHRLSLQKNDLLGLQKWAEWIIDENTCWDRECALSKPPTTFRLTTGPEDGSS